MFAAATKLCVCVCGRQGDPVSSTKRLKANIVAFILPWPARESASQSNHAACGCLVQLIARHPGFQSRADASETTGFILTTAGTHATRPPAGTSSHSTRVAAASHGSSRARISGPLIVKTDRLGFVCSSRALQPLRSTEGKSVFSLISEF